MAKTKSEPKTETKEAPKPIGNWNDPVPDSGETKPSKRQQGLVAKKSAPKEKAPVEKAPKADKTPKEEKPESYAALRAFVEGTDLTKMEVVEGVVDEGEVVHCTRCNRVLKNVARVGKVPFGPVCIKLIARAAEMSMAQLKEAIVENGAEVTAKDKNGLVMEYLLSIKESEWQQAWNERFVDDLATYNLEHVTENRFLKDGSRILYGKGTDGLYHVITVNAKGKVKDNTFEKSGEGILAYRSTRDELVAAQPEA